MGDVLEREQGKPEGDMRPLAEWDDDYILNEVAPSVEKTVLEKKGSALFPPPGSKIASSTTDELAKQVSAFGNSGDGFIVVGIDDKTSQLDGGIPDKIGRETIKQWTEKVIPTLLRPRVLGCEARSFHIPTAHAADRCLLVISVPLSDSRPHWVTSPKEVAYIRVGEHSEPMRPQTFLDIAFRTATVTADILGFEQKKTPDFAGSSTTYTVQPRVCLCSGPACHDWAFELKVEGGVARFSYPRNDESALVNATDHIYFIGSQPLFPGRITPAFKYPLTVTCERSIAQPNLRFLATLYTASGNPISKRFTQNALEGQAAEQLGLIQTD